MKILAFMKYGDQAASTRQRLLQYMPHLRQHEFNVEFLPLHDNQYIQNLASGRRSSPTSLARAYTRRLLQLLSRRDYDLLWVHYELFPYLPGFVERLAGLSGRPVVLDYDDAIFHMYDKHRHPLVRALLSRKLVPLMRAASACICGNDYLQAYAAQYCARTIILPTVVDTDLYRPGDRLSEAEPLTIGWIGSPSTWAYVEPMLPMLQDLLPRYGATLKVVGAGHKARSIAGLAAHEWAEDREVADIQSMDIGIMPLPDEPWARGKCGYKLIQYMACGLPVIASPVGVNSSVVEQGVNGFLASGPDEWSNALRAVIEQPAMRRRMGAAGRERSVAHYSLASQAPRLVALLDELVPQGARERRQG